MLTDLHITFVKKILADGSLCKKCQEVAERLEKDGVLPLINHIVIADERDTQSPGMVLAQTHNVSRAPFFLVENFGTNLGTNSGKNPSESSVESTVEKGAGEVEVFEVYFKLRKYLSQAGLITEVSSTL